MNTFYSEIELKGLGLLSYGKNVLISKKASILNPEKLMVEDNVRVDDYCLLSGEIKIGSYVHISAYSALYGKHGIQIGDFTGLSPRCTVFSVIDDFGGDYLISPMTNEKHNNIYKGKVLIENYSQIGANTIIFPNIKINEGVAVGALSLVKEDLEAWFIYGGIPAKKIRPRRKGLLDFVDEYK